MQGDLTLASDPFEGKCSVMLSSKEVDTVSLGEEIFFVPREWYSFQKIKVAIPAGSW